MATSASAQGPSFSDIGGHLAQLDGRIRAMARRSRRFSWFCWGFLFGVYGGLALYSVVSILFPTVTTIYTTNGSMTTYTSPWWSIPVAAIPGIVLIVLAVREVVLGCYEAGRSTASPARFAADPEGASTGWTETVQRCQQRVSHAKSEVEWSFVPLVLGVFGYAEIFASLVFQLAFPSVGLYYIILGPATALASLILLWPLYRRAKRWISDYQVVLNQQVGELSKLEAEFLWRFAGTGLPA